MDKLVTSQIQFIRGKIGQLQQEYDSRKLRGERLILKQESELRLELERIQDQINSFSNKVSILEGISEPLK